MEGKKKKNARAKPLINLPCLHAFLVFQSLERERGSTAKDRKTETESQMETKG